MIDVGKFEQNGTLSAASGPVAVVLAAGRGSRMMSDQPKVATRLAGKPLLLHVVDHLIQAGFRQQVIVVGYRQAEVRALLDHSSGASYSFVLQEEQRGTAHALLCTEQTLRRYRGPILVTCGDMPLLSADSFATLLRQHRERGNAMSLLSAKIENANGYGRVVRNRKGEPVQVVEEKDASPAQRRINEINVATYIFSAPYIFDLLRQIKANNSQSEYYLPDTIDLHHAAGRSVGALLLANPWEACGINSPEELQFAEEIFKSEMSGSVNSAAQTAGLYTGS